MQTLDSGYILSSGDIDRMPDNTRCAAGGTPGHRADGGVVGHLTSYMARINNGNSDVGSLTSVR